MIDSIEIKDLRGIHEGKLDGLTPLTVLVGPNGCGKSTVLDALLIGAHLIPPEAVGRAVARRKGVREGARWLFWRADDSRRATVTLRAGGATQMRSLTLAQPIHEEAARILLKVGATPPIEFAVEFFPGNRYEYERGKRCPVLVPEVRFVESYAEEGEPLHSLYTRAVEQGRRREACGILQALLPGLQDVEILVEGAAASPIVHLVFAEYSIPAAFGGDGLHALLRIALELAARPRGLVLLEEPEVHQHPASVRQSVRAILAATQRDIQVVFTTHSLELIDTLLAEAKDEDIGRLSLFRVKLDQGRLISVRLGGKEVERARTQIEDDLR